MRIRNWSLGYLFGYIFTTIGIRSFYRKYKVVGKENIPKGKPILFAGNHQNAFLEGAILGYVTRSPIYFLARSDIFKKKAASFMLNSLNALPIYRERDGADYRDKNEEVFEQFYDLLAKKRRIVIFPEGNHGRHQQLRSLKKGIFRIAVGAEAKYNSELDVQVVPVGINYGKFENMGGDLLIQFGMPIAIKDYIADTSVKQEENYIELVGELRKLLSDQMIDIQKMDYYDLIHYTMKTFDAEIGLLERNDGNDLVSEFKRQKGYIEKAEVYIEKDSENANAMLKVVLEFRGLLREEKLSAWLFNKESYAVFGHVFLLILLFPLHLYGILNNYLPYRIPAWFVEKKVADIHFHASIKLLAGSILFVVFWGVQISLVAIFTDNYYWLIYFGSLVISAWISYKYWLSFLKLKGKIRYNKLQKQKENTFNKLKIQHEQLKQFVYKSYQQ
ncbi:MAG: 1-acyl-sn-glycerol-3-phosphate acyltransferase [Flavobacteriales bacterium]|nr:1-acyl-sn-glycerol-3-phosphate acyltransferase [Flavobacteriales bacterium]